MGKPRAYGPAFKVHLILQLAPGRPRQAEAPRCLFPRRLYMDYLLDRGFYNSNDFAPLIRQKAASMLASGVIQPSPRLILLETAMYYACEG